MAERVQTSVACRSCAKPLHHVVVDLGASPLANRYLAPDDLDAMEPTYPLRVYVCTTCWLVQLPPAVAPEEIFSEYAYFSSYSESWLKHAADYASARTADLALDQSHQVVEIASNDGYLLQNFVRLGIPVLGVEPAANVAAAALQKNIPTVVRFFGVATAEELVRQGHSADLLIANNVLAHVPDLNDFVAGLSQLLKPDGVVTLEFPHLLRLIASNQFDTIYHEHFSYFSFIAAERVFQRHGLELYDVEELPSHGGSLRIFGQHARSSGRPTAARVEAMRRMEKLAGLESLQGFEVFARNVMATKRELLAFLIAQKNAGRRIAAYGAPAKGNTLLNYCGIRTDFIDFTVDRSVHKQGRFLPGTRIPILAPHAISERKPDFVVILPWNLRDEIAQQMAYIRDWGGRLVVPIPRVNVLP